MASKHTMAAVQSIDRQCLLWLLTTTVPIIHKFLDKRVYEFAGRAYTASTIYHGRTWLAE